jgi:magnesium transporter
MQPMLKTLVWERETAAETKRQHGRNGRGHFRELDDPAQISDLLADEQHLLWLDLVNPSADELRLITEEFSLHPLAVEDAAQHQQRPKIDEYDNFYLMVIFAIEAADETAEPVAGPVAAADGPAARARRTLVEAGRFKIHEIDLFIGERFLITVHETPLPFLDEMAERWRHNSRAINEGVGVLLYTLLDSIVDAYFPVLDQIVERVTDLEERLFTSAGRRDQPYDTRNLFGLKRDLLKLRRVIAPERDALLILTRQEVPLFDRRVGVYFQDVYDHVVRVTDAIDIYQDLLTSALDSYLSMISNNLNQVMKTLTSLTVILIVPTFIAGIYGMNFEYMPELHWRFGYAFALGTMLLAAALLFVYFRRKGWI